MIKIDERTVELTDDEKDASAMFDDFLDRGCGIVEAMTRTKIRRMNDGKSILDQAFWDWLTGPIPTEG